MKRPAAFFPIVLALGAITLAPMARAQDVREEGPTEIEKCQTISKPGSYKLVKNLTAAPRADCLDITASFVTIDLAGFTISGSQAGVFTRAIAASPPQGQVVEGVTVRNGSISGFFVGVDLGDGSIVEGLRVSGPCPCGVGIGATGIVRNNTVVGIDGGPTRGVGISAVGIVTGNYVINSRVRQFLVVQGSTVIGNTALGSPGFGEIGFLVSCPSNVTNNTAVGNGTNLILEGDGCNNTNNVAP